VGDIRSSQRVLTTEDCSTAKAANCMRKCGDSHVRRFVRAITFLYQTIPCIEGGICDIFLQFFGDGLSESENHPLRSNACSAFGARPPINPDDLIGGGGTRGYQ